MQGSGTFGVESVIQTANTKNRFLILENGTYGVRMASICSRLKIDHKVLSFSEEKSIDLEKLDDYLKKSNALKFSHVVRSIDILIKIYLKI